MGKWNNKWLLTFALGIIVTLFLLPYLRTKGLSFDVLLVSFFGERSIWALPFSLLLIVSLVFVLRKSISKTAA